MRKTMMKKLKGTIFNLFAKQCIRLFDASPRCLHSNGTGRGPRRFFPFYALYERLDTQKARVRLIVFVGILVCLLIQSFVCSSFVFLFLLCVFAFQPPSLSAPLVVCGLFACLLVCLLACLLGCELACQERDVNTDTPVGH